MRCTQQRRIMMQRRTARGYRTMMTFRLAMLLLLAELSSSAASRPRHHLRGGLAPVGLAPATTPTAATDEEAQLLVRGMGLNAVDDVRELAASDL